MRNGRSLNAEILAVLADQSEMVAALDESPVVIARAFRGTGRVIG